MYQLSILLILGTLAGLLPSAYAMDINIIPGPGLAANPDALAAFNRAAAQWTKYFNDPIKVTINADLSDMHSSSIIGSTAAVFLYGGYDLIRNAMVADAAPYANNSIVASLPTASQFSAYVPSGFGLSVYMEATKANLKAMGFTGLDGAFGVSDATITFNSGFSFAYNRSSLSTSTMDFETVAAHEIGHALGFISAVDEVDYLLHNGLTTGALNLEPLDLFRFRPSDNPTTLSEFTNNPRWLVTGGASDFSDTANVYAFSTGYYTGDGRQASHWKDDSLTGTWIGLMDPTLSYDKYFDVAASDVRALDLIGYDLVPLPGAVWLLGSGLLGLGAWRRLRKS